MKHLGDITKISGYDAPIVNVVIGGSPCQDLSIAGKRNGLDGERSGLFMEQIRIIKEMREKDAKSGRTGIDIRPRFMVWENVPGAFSTNRGRDFATVLEETIRIAEPEAPSVFCPADGWSCSGCFLGSGFSIAWRVLDAQYWGVPQRRRRIALVADFGGECAPKILFERIGVQEYFESCKESWKGIARNAKNCIGTASADGFISQEKTHCEVPSRCPVYCLQGNGINRADNAGCGGKGWSDGSCYTLNCVDIPAVVFQTNMIADSGENSIFNDGNAFCFSKTTKPHSVHEAPTIIESDISPTLNTFDVGEARTNTFVVESGKSRSEHTAEQLISLGSTQSNATIISSDISPTLVARAGTVGGNCPIISKKEGTTYTVRRLTPTECERLQGYPDGWTDIGEWIDTKGKKRKTSDSMRYKALGNSIAIPPWLFVLSRLNEYCTEKTMASLFDGIGGFPLIWEFLNGKGSAVWASEIEEFPIAVTKLRFPQA